MSKECVLIRKRNRGPPIHFLHMGQGYSVTNTSRYAARFDLAPGRGKAVSALLATPPTTKMHFFLSCERRPKPLDAPWGRHALPCQNGFNNPLDKHNRGEEFQGSHTDDIGDARAQPLSARPPRSARGRFCLGRRHLSSAKDQTRCSHHRAAWHMADV